MLWGALIGLVVGLIVFAIRSAQSGKAKQLALNDPYILKRQAVLQTTPQSVGMSPGVDYQTVFGVIAEFRFGSDIVMVVAFANGVCGRHHHKGRDRVISHPNHPKVGHLAQNMVVQAAPKMEHLSPVSDLPLPIGKQVNYFLLTDNGTYGFSDQLNLVNKKTHPWQSVLAAQNMLYAKLERIKSV